MLQESFAHADDDMRRVRSPRARVEAERIVDATQSALAADGDLLDVAERAAIEAAVARAARAIAPATIIARIAAAIDALNRATERVRRAPHGPGRRARADRPQCRRAF